MGHNFVYNINFGYGLVIEVKWWMLIFWNVYVFFVIYVWFDGFDLIVLSIFVV